MHQIYIKELPTRYPPFCQLDLGRTWRRRWEIVATPSDLREGDRWAALLCPAPQTKTLPEGSPLHCYHKPAHLRGTPVLHRCDKSLNVCSPSFEEKKLIWQNIFQVWQPWWCLPCFSHEARRRWLMMMVLTMVLMVLMVLIDWLMMLIVDDEDKHNAILLKCFISHWWHCRQLLHSSQMYQHNGGGWMVQQQQ